MDKEKGIILDQYDKFSKNYSENMDRLDEIGNQRFYEILRSVDLRNKKLLDVGCGDGNDLSRIAKMGAIIYGIDPSDEFIRTAKEKNPYSIIEKGKGEDLPFKEKFFDIAVSKYALQTSFDVPQICREVARVLKPEGYFILLSKHPIRQFLEKIYTHKRTDNKDPIDYFKQEIVDSFIFDKTIHLREPSHALSEYFSPEVLRNFDLQYFCEDKEFPASEQLGGMIYPTFFTAKFQRRKE